MTKRLYGISYNHATNAYTVAEVLKINNSVKIMRFFNLGAKDFLKNIFLLNKEIIFAVSSNWVPIKCLETMLKEKYYYSYGEELLKCCCEQEELENLTSNFYPALKAVVTDDAFLCTIPLAFGNVDTDSFVSVYKMSCCYKIGIILNRSLKMVFNLWPTSKEMLASHIDRIRRYFKENFNHTPFPEKICLIGEADALSDMFQNSLKIDTDKLITKNSNQHSAIISLGAALSDAFGNISVFSLKYPSKIMRSFQKAIYISSFVIVLLVLIFFIGFSAVSFIQASKKSVLEAQSKNVIIKIAELKNIINKNDSLAKEILYFRDSFKNKTNFTKVLTTLSNIRKQNLYIDIMSCEIVENSNKVKIAFSGWAENESQIAEFISSVKMSKTFTNVTPVLIEKNNSLNIFEFRIICETIF